MIDEIQSDRIRLFLEFSDPGDGCIQVLQIQMDDSRTDPPTLQTDRLGTENSHSSENQTCLSQKQAPRFGIVGGAISRVDKDNDWLFSPILMQLLLRFNIHDWGNWLRWRRMIRTSEFFETAQRCSNWMRLPARVYLFCIDVITISAQIQQHINQWASQSNQSKKESKSYHRI